MNLWYHLRKQIYKWELVFGWVSPLPGGDSTGSTNLAVVNHDLILSLMQHRNTRIIDPRDTGNPLEKVTSLMLSKRPGSLDKAIEFMAFLKMPVPINSPCRLCVTMQRHHTDKWQLKLKIPGSDYWIMTFLKMPVPINSLAGLMELCTTPPPVATSVQCPGITRESLSLTASTWQLARGEGVNGMG